MQLVSVEGLGKWSHCMVFRVFCCYPYTVWISHLFERATCQKLCWGQGEELAPLCRSTSVKQQLCCLVQLFSWLGDWVLHGLRNCLGHKMGSILHLNLMYTILGDCKGAESVSAFVVWLGVYKRRSLLHIVVFETQMPFGMSSLRRERDSLSCVFSSLYHLFTKVYSTSQCSLSFFATQHKYFNFFSLLIWNSWFSNFSAWSSTLVITATPWPWLSSCISQPCVVRCDGFALVLEFRPYPQFYSFPQNILLPPSSQDYSLTTHTLVFLPHESYSL